MLLPVCLVTNKHSPVINIHKLIDQLGKNRNAFNHQISALLLLPQNKWFYGSPNRLTLLHLVVNTPERILYQQF